LIFIGVNQKMFKDNGHTSKDLSKPRKRNKEKTSIDLDYEKNS